jgi:hypothetical protein
MWEVTEVMTVEPITSNHHIPCNVHGGNLPPSHSFLMGLATRRILPLAFVVNLLLNVAFLAYTGTLRLPQFPGSSQFAVHNAQTKPHTHPSWTTQLAQQPLEPVSFAMVMYGESSATEGLLALKTVLMHVSRPAEFHIICSPDAIPILQSKLNLFSR